MSEPIALLVNPAAGKGRALRAAQEAGQVLSGHGYEVRVLSGPDPAGSLELARQIVADGETLVAVGGDGLVHLALQAVAGTDARFGIIPAGTGNDIARSAGLPLADLAGAAEIIATGHIWPIDAAHTVDAVGAVRWFGTILAAGFDAKVTERGNRTAWLPRGLRYNVAVFAELPVFSPIPYRLEIDGEVSELPAMLIAVGNTPYYGKGMMMCPDAVLDDGLLDLTIVHPVSRFQLVKIFPKVYSGRHVAHPRVEVRRGVQVRIDSPGVLGYADGEPLGGLPMTITAVPGAVRLLAPTPIPSA
jgi:diacylglycerol kinase (ATP)